MELEEREKWLVDQQMQELAVTQKRLDDLLASRASEAQYVWRFLGQTNAAWCLSASVPFALDSHCRRLVPCSRSLTRSGQKSHG
jgi:hypothetical protein